MGRTEIEIHKMLKTRSKGGLASVIAKFVASIDDSQQRDFLDILEKEPAAQDEVVEEAEAAAKSQEAKRELKRPEQLYAMPRVIETFLRAKEKKFQDWTSEVLRSRLYKSKVESLHMISDKLLVKIFSFLSVPVDLFRIEQCCKRFQILSYSPVLWRDIEFTPFKDLLRDESCRTTAVHGKRCQNIATLNLSECQKITDLSVKYFTKNCRKLQSIHLENCIGLTDKSLRKISKYCKELKVLNISGCSLVTNFGITLLANGATTKLEVLEIRHLQRVSEEGIGELAEKMQHLKRLDLQDCRVTDSWLDSIASSKIARNLRYVVLAMCHHVTDKGLVRLGKAATHMEYLDLTNCYQLTDKGVAAVGSSCQNLKTLILRGCDLLSDHALRLLADGCKGLETLDLQNCDLITDRGITLLNDRAANLRMLDVTDCNRISAVALDQLDATHDNNITIIGAGNWLAHEEDHLPTDPWSTLNDDEVTKTFLAPTTIHDVLNPIDVSRFTFKNTFK